MPERLRAAMARLRPGRAGELVVVAVSGGADSVALLRALVEVGANVVVGHVNHLLRGEESDGDERFVVDLGERLGVPVRSARLTVPSGNMEGQARRVRYDWLTEVAKDTSAGWIATGHTAEDQAETVLHRLIRGTGLQGLRGIASVRRDQRERATERSQARGDDKVAPVLRPLLTISRSDLEEYLKQLNQPFRTDSTNADPAFTRNRIRAELLPLLRTFNPAIVDVLGRLSVQAEELFAEQETETAQVLRTVELPRAGGMLILDAEKLSALGEAKTRNVLRMLWDREQWPVNAMTFDHWRRAAMIAGCTHPAADFPDGVHVRRTGKVVQLERKQISPQRAQEGT